MENRNVKTDSENLSKALILSNKILDGNNKVLESNDKILDALEMSYKRMFYALLVISFLFLLHIFMYFGTDYEIPEPNITNTNTNSIGVDD